MKIPPRLIPLVEDGIIDEVIGQVKSGKEADVFTVRVGEEIRCAKVYKDANNRSFRQAVQYQEGRSVQNSRTARAMSKRSRYGQKESEASWISAEVGALNTLSALGLRVPKPFGFFDGVLIMELIVGEDGEPAPRLNDLSLSPETALAYHQVLIAQVVRMLCAGIIHGDLSEFNVLVDSQGPVIIDLPQAVNAAGNNSAPMMFERDVDNLARYFGRFEPSILTMQYAKEIWAIYEKGKLAPHTELTGKFQESSKKVDVGGVLNAIGDARKEHEERQLKKTRTSDPDAPPKSWQGKGTLGDTSHDAPRRGSQDAPRRSSNDNAPRHGSNQPAPRPSANPAQSDKPPSDQGSWGRRASPGGPKRPR
jgi:RIO kinase 1